ncbi:trimethylamine methyltransferase family protein, partial [Nostoc sp. NIES-2111]
LMQRDYVYPVVGDRWSPNEWNEKGRPDYVSRAVRRTEDLLRRHHPRHIDRSIDDRIRQRFPIKRDRAHMGDVA